MGPPERRPFFGVLHMVSALAIVRAPDAPTTSLMICWPAFFRVKVRDNRVLLGLHMGDRSLQGADRGGATPDIIDPLSVPSSPLMVSGGGT